MKTYLVGGAVRDKLLDLPVQEHDWVVVGTTAEEMLALGYRQVGNSFPVFLHPESKEEYALARTEKKTGPGYQGFSVDFSPNISLEDDLQRRDLTINAIAEDADGKIIDPLNGQHDLETRLLRHISPAFIEDPVRVLRVARFHARFADLGFQVATETLKLMQKTVADGEVNHLVPERVWQEIFKALQTKQAWLFFETLHNSHALKVLLPEALDTLPRCNWALQRACEQTHDAVVRFAAWAGTLPKKPIQELSERFRAPKEFSELALLVEQQLPFFENCTQLPPPEILDGLKAIDAFRRPERFEKFLLAAEAIAGANTERESWPQPQREYLHTAKHQAAAINARDLTKLHLEGKELADELDMHRRAAISKVKRTYRWAKFR